MLRYVEALFGILYVGFLGSLVIQRLQRFEIKIFTLCWDNYVEI